ncbi:MAG: hypothetical protein JST42_00230 [Bacteroidetes bacterium]|nr:hypothetical protein [Bacteroidota bacterium]
MKRIEPSVPVRYLLLLAAPFLLHSCATSGPGAPGPRKKMPDLTSDYSFEGRVPFDSHSAEPLGSDAYAFHTSVTQLEIDGSLRDFIYIPLPDPSNDSLAVALIQSYKTMALPMLNSLTSRQYQGVAIDLSAHTGTATRRSDFVLEKTGAFHIPVVVIWDAASEGRLETLKSLAIGLPGISLNTISR